MATNYEKIKNMTVDEMADLIADLCSQSCQSCPCRHYMYCDEECANSIKLWLQSEVDNEQNNKISR